MAPVPKPIKPKVEPSFWNDYFKLEMADTFLVQTTGRCRLNLGPAVECIGLRKVPLPKRKLR